MRYLMNLMSLILLVLASGITYGILEAKYIPTDTAGFATIPWLGNHFAYYHLCLLSLMTVASFSLAILHLRDMAEHRKKYMLLMGFAMLPLSLLIEDITWFCTRWTPIHRNEWTVFPAGWALNLGVTYIPLWYLAVLIFSTLCLWLADHYAKIGSKKFLTSR
jgi:hypothetical protein